MGRRNKTKYTMERSVHYVKNTMKQTGFCFKGTRTLCNPLRMWLYSGKTSTWPVGLWWPLKGHERDKRESTWIVQGVYRQEWSRSPLMEILGPFAEVLTCYSWGSIIYWPWSLEIRKKKFHKMSLIRIMGIGCYFEW